MDERDYNEAWNLISSWHNPDRRESALSALQRSDRRPYVVIAMFRIGAFLSSSGNATYEFAEQIAATGYVNMERGILHITDQILLAVSEDDSPENEGVWDTLAQVPASLASDEVG